MSLGPMPVKLLMGPYDVLGVIRHRIQRIHGLTESLNQAGYLVELVPTVHLNRLSIHYYGREIFRCNLQHLEFNQPAREDPLCQKIINVIKEHESRFVTEENVPNFSSVIEGVRFIERKKNLPTEQLLSGTGMSLWYEMNKPHDRTTGKKEKSEEISSSTDKESLEEYGFVISDDVNEQKSTSSSTFSDDWTATDIFPRIRSRSKMRRVSTFRSEEIRAVSRDSISVQNLLANINRNLSSMHEKANDEVSKEDKARIGVGLNVKLLHNLVTSKVEATFKSTSESVRPNSTSTTSSYK